MIRQEKKQQILRWHIYPDANALYERAASAIVRIARAATTERGAFHVVLSGGSTPRPLYQRLRTMDTHWPAWHIYFGDERCVPRDHADRNSAMAASVWLNHVPIPAAQIYEIPAEQGAHAAAQIYAKLLDGVAVFDLVLLGLGEDGHTAGLFPGARWGDEVGAPATLAVEAAPKPPAQRVTLGARRLSQAREIFVLITGGVKYNALAAWRAGENLPVRAIRPVGGVDVFLEQSVVDAGLID
ncbi:MAG: 6-phosphogluconolactonase [Acidiferrobacterales bacterium]